MASASAPGKLILLGEHSVVYGHAAIAAPVTAVAAHAVVRSWPGALGVVSTSGARGERREWRIDVASAPDSDPLATAVRETLRHVACRTWPRWRIEVTSSVPLERGMGSSAAVAVAIIRALAAALRVELGADEVAQLALEAERRVHGTPSGIDNTVIAWGVPIRFAAGAATPLAIGAPLELVIADSGQTGSTRAMVEAVRARREADPGAFEAWFVQVDDLVASAVRAIAEGNATVLGRTMRANHELLRGMGVSTPALESLVEAARQADALGAKLSGAGGGGVVVALTKNGESTAVARALAAAGARSTICTVLAPGASPLAKPATEYDTRSPLSPARPAGARSRPPGREGASRPVFMKLGGALLTDKEQRQRLRAETLQRIAAEIAAWPGARSGQLVLAHGGGSFAHAAAADSGFLAAPSDPLRLAVVAAAARRLNGLVVDALIAANLPAVGVPGSLVAQCRDGRVQSVRWDVVADLLAAGALPVLYGDAAPDSVRGGTIASTESLLTALAGCLPPRWIVLLTDVDGVFVTPPSAAGSPEASTTPIGAITIADRPRLGQWLGGARPGALDVTGGMATKVAQMLDLVERQPEVEVRIVSGLRPGAARACLEDRPDAGGTVIRAR